MRNLDQDVRSLPTAVGDMRQLPGVWSLYSPETRAFLKRQADLEAEKPRVAA